MTSSKGRIGCDHHSRRSRRNGQSHGAVTTSYSTRIHVVLLYLVLLPVLSAFSVLPVHVSIVVHVRMYCMYMYRYSTTCTVQCTTYRYQYMYIRYVLVDWRQYTRRVSDVGDSTLEGSPTLEAARVRSAACTSSSTSLSDPPPPPPPEARDPHHTLRYAPSPPAPPRCGTGHRGHRSFLVRTTVSNVGDS